SQVELLVPARAAGAERARGAQQNVVGLSVAWITGVQGERLEVEEVQFPPRRAGLAFQRPVLPGALHQLDSHRRLHLSPTWTVSSATRLPGRSMVRNTVPPSGRRVDAGFPYPIGVTHRIDPIDPTTPPRHPGPRTGYPGP